MLDVVPDRPALKNTIPSGSTLVFKISGQILSGGHSDVMWNECVITNLVTQIKELYVEGFNFVLIVGGGNIIRGNESHVLRMVQRTTKDKMGMMATMMNVLAIESALKFHHLSTHATSSMPNAFMPTYQSEAVAMALHSRQIVLCAGGLGLPYFSTDTTAVLRGLECNAAFILKGTRVSGVYSHDPLKHSNAQFYPTISYNQLLQRQLGIMDMTALCLARDHHLPIIVFNTTQSDALTHVMRGTMPYSYISDQPGENVNVYAK